MKWLHDTHWQFAVVRWDGNVASVLAAMLDKRVARDVFHVLKGDGGTIELLSSSGVILDRYEPESGADGEGERQS
jgi:hypothetical protein